MSRVPRTNLPGSFQAPHLLFSRGSASAQGQVNWRHWATLGEGLTEQQPTARHVIYCLFLPLGHSATVTCNNVRISSKWGHSLRLQWQKLAGYCMHFITETIHTHREKKTWIRKLSPTSKYVPSPNITSMLIYPSIFWKAILMASLATWNSFALQWKREWRYGIWRGLIGSEGGIEFILPLEN